MAQILETTDKMSHVQIVIKIGGRGKDLRIFPSIYIMKITNLVLKFFWFLSDLMETLTYIYKNW